MSSETSSTGLGSDACWSRCGRDAEVWFSCPECRGPAPSTAQAGSTGYLLCRGCADSWVCPFCNRVADNADIRTDSDAGSSSHYTVTTLITTTPSATALRQALGRAPSIQGVYEGSAPGAADHTPPAWYAAVVQECQEQRHHIARLQAENEALRQQLEADQGAAVDNSFENAISTKLNELLDLPAILLQSVPVEELHDCTRHALIQMLFNQFDYKGRGILYFEEVSDLSSELGRGPLSYAEFERVCVLSGTTAESGLQLDQIICLYDASNRDPVEDASQALRFGKTWRIAWAQFIDVVLHRIDDASGGRCLPYEGILCINDQQLHDHCSLFLNSNLSPDAVLDRIQRDLEELQSLFYEWGVWLRQHRISISCKVASPSDHNWTLNTACDHCGASPEALDSEFNCLGCGRLRCRVRPLAISGIPRTQAKRIEELHRTFMELLAGFGYRVTSMHSSTFFTAFTTSLADLRAPPPLAKEFRLGIMTPRSLLHRLVVRASEASAARSRFHKLTVGNTFKIILMSKDDFLADRLTTLKADYGISEDTYQQLGPKDANCNFVLEPTINRADDIAWPLSYSFFQRNVPPAEAIPPCTICGRVFFRNEDFNSHQQSAHLGRAWAFNG